MDYGEPTPTKEELERREKEANKRCVQRIRELHERAIKSIMSLGYSKKEANEWLEKLAPIYGQKMKKTIQEINASLQGKKTSKKTISQPSIQKRLGRSGR